MAAERGVWIEKWDRPEVVVSPEEMEAWRPLIEGEKAARRAAKMLELLTAGRDSEIESLRSETAGKLRRSYTRLWVAWTGLDSKRDHRWALDAVTIEINGKVYRKAREFDLEAWIRDDVPEIRSQAVVGVRTALTLLDSRASRLERRHSNEIIALIGKELDYLDWSL